MKRILRWLLLGVALVALTACGGGGSGSDTSFSNGDVPSSGIQKRTITGYAEDDPIPNAKVMVKDEDGNIVVQASADSNGKYTLEGAFKDGSLYTLESTGVLGDRNITLHSLFRFSNDRVVNANPITELKYRLVQSGKSLEEAEKLVREYFSIVSGEKLEQNRFDTQDSVAIGMSDLAKLYDGKLPVDAIEKIKEDILRNASQETKDYSYRSMLQKKIELQSSGNSVKVGQDVNVTIVGIDDLNKNYMIRWSGFEGSQSEENKTNVSFTVSMPQDVYVKAAVYERDGNRTKYITSAESVINFYKTGIERNITIENASIDNNFTIGESSITVPAGTLSEGQTLRVVQRDTGSDKTVAEFEIDADGVEGGSVVFNYKYDPYLVSDPRSLRISRYINGQLSVLKVENIDYDNHTIHFKIPFNDNLQRAFFVKDFSIIIDQVDKLPTQNDISILYSKASSVIDDVIEKYFKPSEVENAKLYLKLNTATTQNGAYARYLRVLQGKTKGIYNFNILSRALNNIIAFKQAENIMHSSWNSAQEAYANYHSNGCEWSVYFSKDAYIDAGCALYKEKFSKKIIDTNKMISAWVGNIKLTDQQATNLLLGQIGFDMYLTLITPLPSNKVELASYLAEVGGAIGGYFLPDDLDSDKITYTYNIIQRSGFFIISNVKLAKKITEFAKSFSIDVVKGEYFQYIKNSMLEENALKSAPIILALQKHYDELSVEIPKGEDGVTQFMLLKAKKFNKDDFRKKFFPNYPYRDMLYCDMSQYDVLQTIPEGSKCYHYDENYLLNYIFGVDKIMDDESDWNSFGSLVDPDNRLSKLLLEGNSGVSDQERASSFIAMTYAFSDSQNNLNDEIVSSYNHLKDISYAVAAKLLSDIYYLPFSAISKTIEVKHLFGGSTYKIIIDPRYKIAHMQQFINLFRSVNSSEANLNLNEVDSYINFEEVMTSAKLKLTNEQLDKFKIKKIKVELYGIGLTFNEDDNTWVLDQSIKEHQTYIAEGDINSKFVYDSEYEKNVLSFADLFADKDFSIFDNKLVGMKITLVYERNGIEKVSDASFVFSTVADQEHVEETNYTGATLKSSVKDAATGQPIENAQVTLVPGGLTDFTDENGNYVVSGLAAGHYKIVISKVGYKQVEADLELQEDETKVYEVSLAIDDEHATDVGGANITLKDALNGNIITNGYIKVREGQNNKDGDVLYQVTNDGNSSVNLELMPNVYTVEVGANGYSKSFNTITVVGDTNSTYEFTISPVLPDDQMRIVLTWGENPSDLDSHLVRLSGNSVDYHVYYSNMNPANADASLDTDDTSSYGPETITISGLDADKTYKYYVHDFSNGSDHNDTALKSSGAKVEVYYGDQSKTFYVPNENGNAWKVFEIVNGEIVPCVDGCIFGVDSETDEGIGQRSLERGSQDRSYFRNLPTK